MRSLLLPISTAVLCLLLGGASAAPIISTPDGSSLSARELSDQSPAHLVKRGHDPVRWVFNDESTRPAPEAIRLRLAQVQKDVATMYLVADSPSDTQHNHGPVWEDFVSSVRWLKNLVNDMYEPAVTLITTGEKDRFYTWKWLFEKLIEMQKFYIPVNNHYKTLAPDVKKPADAIYRPEPSQWPFDLHFSGSSLPKVKTPPDSGSDQVTAHFGWLSLDP